MHGTTLQPREVALPKFGYTGPTGPVNWAGLAIENLDCASGLKQSPINLTPESARAMTTPPKIQIANVEAAEFENLGTTVEVIVNGTLEAPDVLGAGEFQLKQFHFHTPSEHRIQEEYFPLEVHMVHEGRTCSPDFLVPYQRCSLTISISSQRSTRGYGRPLRIVVQ